MVGVGLGHAFKRIEKVQWRCSFCFCQKHGAATTVDANLGKMALQPLGRTCKHPQVVAFTQA